MKDLRLTCRITQLLFYLKSRMMNAIGRRGIGVRTEQTFYETFNGWCWHPVENVSRCLQISRL
jgi:hypothetical protein